MQVIVVNASRLEQSFRNECTEIAECIAENPFRNGLARSVAGIVPECLAQKLRNAWDEMHSGTIVIKLRVWLRAPLIGAPEARLAACITIVPECISPHALRSFWARHSGTMPATERANSFRNGFL